MFHSMPEDANPLPHAIVIESPESGFARFWTAIPDVLFRIVGVSIFVGFVVWRTRHYGAILDPANSRWQTDTLRISIHLAARFLVDLTYILIVAGFCFRIVPIKRATDPGRIAFAFVGAFWPFLPFLYEAVFEFLDRDLCRAWREFMWRDPVALYQIIIAGSLILTGLIIEIWGYAYLVRSLSIVPEARVLKITGPYRFVRHPIYFGQFLAQAGVWLVLANTHWVWIAFFVCFVAIQLVRTRMEDAVLEDAFGETHREWKRRTFWFT
jgi:protein-S-isoprenylcysteine O-methyltransferase Ste14